MARAARFYGWTHDYMMQMDLKDLLLYVECIGYIKAEELLYDLKASDWPNMKSERRRTFHRQLHTMANPKIDTQEKPKKSEEVATVFKGLMSG